MIRERQGLGEDEDDTEQYIKARIENPNYVP
jgi:hypothetical protein